MVRFYLSVILILIFALAACGGGGGGGETVSQPAGSSSNGSSGGSSGGQTGGNGGPTPSPTQFTVTQSIASTLVATTSDGVDVYRLVDLAGDGDIYVGYVEDSQLANKLLNITSQTNSPAQQNGNEFSVTR